MADIEILELRAYEARCLECGETGPIETSAFFAMVWEEAHACVAIRIDADAAELAAAILSPVALLRRMNDASPVLG